MLRFNLGNFWHESKNLIQPSSFAGQEWKKQGAAFWQWGFGQRDLNWTFLALSNSRLTPKVLLLAGFGHCSLPLLPTARICSLNRNFREVVSESGEQAAN